MAEPYDFNSSSTGNVFGVYYKRSEEGQVIEYPSVDGTNHQVSIPVWIEKCFADTAKEVIGHRESIPATALTFIPRNMALHFT